MKIVRDLLIVSVMLIAVLVFYHASAVEYKKIEGYHVVGLQTFDKVCVVPTENYFDFSCYTREDDI